MNLLVHVLLIHHMTQLAKGEGAKAVCKDCA